MFFAGGPYTQDSAHDGRAFIIKESPIQAAVFTIYPFCGNLSYVP